MVVQLEAMLQRNVLKNLEKIASFVIQALALIAKKIVLRVNIKMFHYAFAKIVQLYMVKSAWIAMAMPVQSVKLVLVLLQMANAKIVLKLMAIQMDMKYVNHVLPGHIVKME